MRSRTIYIDKDLELPLLVLLLGITMPFVVYYFVSAFRSWQKKPFDQAKYIQQKQQEALKTSTEKTLSRSTSPVQVLKLSHSTPAPSRIKPSEVDVSFLEESTEKKDRLFLREKQEAHRKATAKDWKTDLILQNLQLRQSSKQQTAMEKQEKRKPSATKTRLKAVSIETSTASPTAKIQPSVSSSMVSHHAAPVIMQRVKSTEHSERRKPRSTGLIASFSVTNQRRQNYISLISAAIPAIEYHAQQLLRAFDQHEGSDVSSLAFMYHLHRYNLLRGFLYKTTFATHHGTDAQDGFEHAKQLRTMLVHSTGHIMNHFPVLTETQQYLAGFIAIEVKNITEKKRAELAMLSGERTTVANRIEFGLNQDFITRAPLYPMLTMRAQDSSDAEFYKWLSSSILPLMIELYDRSGVETAEMPFDQHNPYLDAFKWCIIMCGEYCNRDRRLRAASSPNAALISFITQCKELRNRLAHDITNLDIKTLKDFAAFVRQSFEIPSTPAPQISPRA